ncbi:hypothetical protein K505DRAFT_357887 [Melanomma pulvis-pyrius CBS 109.77]|uniref:Uncharacterized protein n=1 Tax=Melanomma pulvis-pyrius CBS 109.77 TaxID=1314802 RepID=A0A6A6XPX1_9PLEO|nr:hypothetical protein K505DRAFT_357887 [Melanomma pulvis-pyrius CBS 109.77]
MDVRPPEILSWFLAWPYYWTLCHYTIFPIRKIVMAQYDENKFRKATKVFFHGKLNEAKLVTLASTLSAAASFGAFSWTGIENSPWILFALWYLSLVLAILSLITAGQQSALIHTIIQHEDDFYTTLHTQAILKLVAVKKDITSQSQQARNQRHSQAP